MFIRPSSLAFRKIIAVSRRRRRRRVCDLGDQVGRGCFRDTIYEDTEKWNLEKDVKADAKAEEQTLSIMEPSTLLIFVKPYPGEVRFKLFYSK